MSDFALVTALVAPWAGIALVLTWQYVHQKQCGERWADHERRLGELTGRVKQFHEDHKK